MEAPLDRALFSTIHRIVGLRVNKLNVHNITKCIGRDSLFGSGLLGSYRNVRSVVPDDANDRVRVVLLHPRALEDEAQMELTTDLKEKLGALLKTADVKYVEDPNQLATNTWKDLAQPKRMEITLTYEQRSADDVLRSLLPAGTEIPSSFETVGHIAHLNLREEHLPYKYRIGRIIMDKSPAIKTVVNKIGMIETQFRTFPMEVLAGEPNFEVTSKAHGLAFKFDFSKVYWNTRLSDEHERLCATRMAPKDVLVDGFCGVGPFALRAALKGLSVLANDLNPESVESLKGNLVLNKIPSSPHVDLQRLPENGTVAPFNEDARAFLRRVMHELPRLLEGEDRETHIVMNLPLDAPEFVDSLLYSIPSGVKKLPWIHCYCFAPTQSEHVLEGENSLVAVVGRRLEKAFSHKVSLKEGLEVRVVRDVAPNKLMVCAHFRLPESIAYQPSSDVAEAGASEEQSAAKRVKMTE